MYWTLTHTLPTLIFAVMTVTTPIWVPPQYPSSDAPVTSQNKWDNSGTTRERENEMLPQPIKAKEVAAASGWTQEKPGFFVRLLHTFNWFLAMYWATRA